MLERERPSPREDQLFRLLNQVVWGAVGLTGFYLLLRLPAFQFDASDARPIARATALIYLVVIPVFISNWGLVNKLWRAARRQKQLAPSWRRRLLDRFTARRRQNWLLNFATLALSGLGYVVGFVGSAGLVLELTRQPIRPAQLSLAAVMIAFGLSCIFVHFMARGRERLEVIAELRSTLLAVGTPQTKPHLAGDLYDEIAMIERAQISADRRESVKAGSGLSSESKFSLKEHRTVREAKLALVPDTLAKVQACIDCLTADPRTSDYEQPRDATLYVRVPDTSLEIEFSVDWEVREVRVFSLSAARTEQPAVFARSEGDGGR